MGATAKMKKKISPGTAQTTLGRRRGEAARLVCDRGVVELARPKGEAIRLFGDLYSVERLTIVPY
jgi:hypothetical protein